MVYTVSYKCGTGTLGKRGLWFYLFLKQINYLKLVESHRSASCYQKKSLSYTEDDIIVPRCVKNLEGPPAESGA